MSGPCLQEGTKAESGRGRHGSPALFRCSVRYSPFLREREGSETARALLDLDAHAGGPSAPGPEEMTTVKQSHPLPPQLCLGRMLVLILGRDQDARRTSIIKHFWS